MGVNDWMQNLVFAIPLTLSLTVHEWAHAFSAYKLGDDTAQREGRLTLNPIVHIDPVGTLLLPMLGVPFGWAKPVPVNPARFRRGVNMSAGMAITAFAGPLSNLILALICAILLGVLYRAQGPVGRTGVHALLAYGLTGNIGLAIFNMVPVPPLDGSRILEHFLPSSLRNTWDTVKRFGPFLLLLLMWSGTGFLRGPINAVTNVFVGLVQTIAS